MRTIERRKLANSVMSIISHRLTRRSEKSMRVPKSCSCSFVLLFLCFCESFYTGNPPRKFGSTFIENALIIFNITYVNNNVVDFLESLFFLACVSKRCLNFVIFCVKTKTKQLKHKSSSETYVFFNRRM